MGGVFKWNLKKNKLKKQLGKSESKMIEGNLIMIALREDEWVLDDNQKD